LRRDGFDFDKFCLNLILFPKFNFMKKILTTLFFALICYFSFAQNKSGYGIYIGCFASGDTIPDGAVSEMPVLSLLKDGEGQKDAVLSSFSAFVHVNGKIIELQQEARCLNLLNTNYGKPLFKGEPRPQKIVIENITISVKQNGEITKRKLSSQTFYRAKAANKKCSDVPAIVTFDGKILTGNKTKEPLVNQKVVLKDSKTSETQSTTTDKYGDFTFQNVNVSNAYSLEVIGNASIKEDVVFLAKPNGMVVREFQKNGSTFVYELLPAELASLASEKAEDTELALNIFSQSKNKEVTIVENIYYEENSADIKSESFKKIDAVVDAMKKNKTLHLGINSYTDSKGDDASNLALSEKRAQKVLDYIFSKGVEKDRLKAIGFGETQILNRCTNGVDCSEKENQLNRRTEFKFTK